LVGSGVPRSVERGPTAKPRARRSSRPRRDRGEATRQRLAESAARLFAERGFEGVSLDAIAEAAGVNKALVSYHFGGKRGLYTAVILDILREVEPELSRVRQSDRPAGERLGEFIETLARFLRKHPHFPFILLREEMSGGRNLDPKVMKEFLAFFETDREILEEGMRTEVFRPVDPHSTHLTLIGAMVFFAVTQPLRDSWKRRVEFRASDPKWDAHVERVRELVLRGLAQ